MKNRNPSNIEIVKQFISQLNDRFLRDDGPHYDMQTRQYNVGTFYLYETMGKNGYAYEVREVLDEKGSFKSLSPQGHTVEGIMYFLDGYLMGHFATCDMLGYTLEVTEDGDDKEDPNYDWKNPNNLSKEELEAADKKDDLAIETAKIIGEYEPYEGEGDLSADEDTKDSDEEEKKA
jgi:hypothetical protein